MTDVQVLIRQLRNRGWKVAAIEDALDVGRNTMWPWINGEHSPANAKAVAMTLSALLQRQPPSKRRHRFTGQAELTTTQLAKRQGVTANYIAMLCRAGRIEAHKRGHDWYIPEPVKYQAAGGQPR